MAKAWLRLAPQPAQGVELCVLASGLAVQASGLGIDSMVVLSIALLVTGSLRVTVAFWGDA